MNIGQHSLRRNAGQVLYTKSNFLAHFSFLPSRHERPRFILSLLIKHIIGLGWSIKLKAGMSSGIIRIFHELEHKMPVNLSISVQISKLKYKVVSKSEHYSDGVFWENDTGEQKKKMIWNSFFFLAKPVSTRKKVVIVAVGTYSGLYGIKQSHCFSAQGLCKNTESSCCCSTDWGPRNSPRRSQFKANGSGLVN